MSRIYFEKQIKIIFGESYYYVNYDKDLKKITIVYFYNKFQQIPNIITYRLLREVYLLTACDDLTITKNSIDEDTFSLIINNFFLPEEKFPVNSNLFQ